MHVVCAQSPRGTLTTESTVSWIWETTWTSLQSSGKLQQKILRISSVHILWLWQWWSNREDAFDCLCFGTFCLFFPNWGKILRTNHVTAKKSKYAFSICCWNTRLRGWRKSGAWFRSTICEYYKHCPEPQARTRIPSLPNWREVFCMLKLADVEGLFPSPKQYGARVKEN